MRTDARCYRKRILLSLGLMILCGIYHPALGQKAEARLPLVNAGEMPLYPLIARAARVQGVVKIKVTTNGKDVTSVDAVSGPPMLVRFAEENIRTWKFSERKPATFVATFEYVIEKLAQCGYTNDEVILKLPLEVHISAKSVQTCDPAS